MTAVAGNEFDIFYDAIDLTPNDEQAFFEAMEEFPRLLAQPPLEIKLNTTRLPTELRDKVVRTLKSKSEIASGNAALIDVLLEYQMNRVIPVVLACQNNHEFAIKAKQNNPAAIWGGALWPLALVYHLEEPKLTTWHESLHLLGAEDCYMLPDEGPTCHYHGCIMQYAPTGPVSWPIICDQNIIRIRNRMQPNVTSSSATMNMLKG